MIAILVRALGTIFEWLQTYYKTKASFHGVQGPLCPALDIILLPPLSINSLNTVFYIYIPLPMPSFYLGIGPPSHINQAKLFISIIYLRNNLLRTLSQTSYAYFLNEYHAPYCTQIVCLHILFLFLCCVLGNQPSA